MGGKAVKDEDMLIKCADLFKEQFPFMTPGAFPTLRTFGRLSDANGAPAQPEWLEGCEIDPFSKTGEPRLKKRDLDKEIAEVGRPPPPPLPRMMRDAIYPIYILHI